MRMPVFIIYTVTPQTTNWSELISMIASVVGAVIVPIVIYLLGRKYTSAAIEIQLRDLITKAKNKSLESGSVDEKINAANLEEVLNAYDEACSKYLNRQVIRRNFERTYKTEIKNLVESELFNNHFYGENSAFINIIAVYKKWNNQK